MRAFFLFLLCLFLPLQSWAVVYRWVDEHGRTVYSDTPHPGAVVVDLPAIPPPSPSPKPVTAEPKPTTKQAARPYTALAIAKPGNEDTIHNNIGSVEVELTAFPLLQIDFGHKIRMFLDGVAIPQTRMTVRFTLTEIERGGHTLRASVEDPSGQTLITSAPVTFYVWQGSPELPPRYDEPPLPKPAYPPIQPGPPLPLPPPPPPLPAPGYPPTPAPTSH